MSRVELPPVPEFSNRQAASYNEAGEMLRHYSNCRIGVLSLIFPICVALVGAVVTLSLSQIASTYLLIAEGMLFVYAVALSIFFAVKYEQTRRMLVKIEAGEEVSVYTVAISSAVHGNVALDGIDRSIITAGIVTHVALYLYYVLR